MVQKIINVLALASTVVSVAVVGTGGYVYLNREAIIEDIKEKALGGLGGSLGGGALTGDVGLPYENPTTTSTPVPPAGLGIRQF